MTEDGLEAGVRASATQEGQPVERDAARLGVIKPQTPCSQSKGKILNQEESRMDLAGVAMVRKG